MKKRFISVLSALVVAVMSVTALVSMAYYDANGDRQVSMADAVLIQQFLTGKYNISNIDTIDFDENYIVSPMDISKIQAYCLNLIDKGTLGRKLKTTELESHLSTDYNVYNAQTGGFIRNYTLESAFNDVDNSKTVSTYNMVDGNDDRVVDWKGKEGVVQILCGNFMSSGFVVGPHVIATAAHCVFDGNKNEVIKTTRVRLFDENGELDKICYAVEAHIPVTYVDTGLATYDYALLTVTDDLSDYAKFELGVALDSATKNKIEVLCTGFPVEVNNEPVNNGGKNDAKYTSKGNLKSAGEANANSRQLFATNYLSPGNSGGPIYVAETSEIKDTYTVIAIFTTETSAGFSNAFIAGTRITPELLRFYNDNPNIQW